jgi:hypothetical protein
MDAVKYYLSVLKEWRGNIAIVTLFLNLIGRLIPQVAALPWYIKYVQPLLWAACAMFFLWAFYSVHRKVQKELSTARAELVTVKGELDDRKVMNKIRLQKLLGDLQHNFDYLTRNYVSWTDQAWISIDTALQAIPEPLRTDIQTYYREMRSIRQELNQRYARHFNEFEAYASKELPRLIETLQAVIKSL